MTIDITPSYRKHIVLSGNQETCHYHSEFRRGVAESAVLGDRAVSREGLPHVKGACVWAGDVMCNRNVIFGADCRQPS